MPRESEVKCIEGKRASVVVESTLHSPLPLTGFAVYGRGSGSHLKLGKSVPKSTGSACLASPLFECAFSEVVWCSMCVALLEKQ